MSLGDVPDISDAEDKERAKWIGVFIGALAVLLAICSMLGSNSTKDATRANIEASNTYAFYQARNIRQLALRNQSEHLETMLAAFPNLPADAKKTLNDRIKDHNVTAERYESDPKENDGKKELLAKARALEAERDVAMRRDPYYDFAQALLQIAIVLGSVAIITGGNHVLFASLGSAVLGILMLINGAFLLLKIPGLG
jgi:Domain of unknown function (DUF4337)